MDTTSTCPALGDGVHLKLEFMFPSGSFKDRGTTVLVSEMRRLGRTSLMEDSSGNAGASLAMYAADRNVLPDLRAIRHLGGQARSNRDCRIAAQEYPGHARGHCRGRPRAADDPSQPFYASHNWHPMFVEGVKTVGFEIWEQLGFRAPDVVVAPAGNGSMILGILEAFLALQRAGEINRIPKIIAVQAEACAPLVHAFENGMDDVAPFEKLPTLAEGIASARPIRARQVLAAIRASAAQRSPSQKTGYFLVFDDLQRLASSWSQRPPWWPRRLQYLSIEVS